jgi:HD-GYP domain-containing protein (c-di-GMP phosphodiesterase class II)
MSVSLGVVSLPEHAPDVASLLRLADQSLYLAKDLGRDRVQVGPSRGPAPSEPPPASDAVAFLCALADRLDAATSPDEHAAAVGRWSAAVAESLGLDAQARTDCYWSGRLHDLGNLQVPEQVLAKPGPLDDHEWSLVRQHPRSGADLLRLLPDTERIAAIVDQHHERVDGGGYPDGLTTAQIRIEARIVAVCDAYAAMLAARGHAETRSPAEARSVLLSGAGTQWDDQVVDAFVRLLDGGSVLPLGPSVPRQGGRRSTSDR